MASDDDTYTGRSGHDAWDELPPRERMRVDLDGYEGPLDVLLELARGQKVDLTKISMVELADQYLEFIRQLQQLRLEVAADYLVMAAWLAYMKSRLLLPLETAEEDELSGTEMADALAFQLRRLESMRDAGMRLMAQPRLGQDVFARGAPEGVTVVRKPVFEVSLFDLLTAYGEQRRRTAGGGTLSIAPTELYTVDQALERLRDILGRMPDWQMLSSFLPVEMRGGLRARSAIASYFAASLELAKSGAAQLRQDRTYGPIFVRAARMSSRRDE